MNKEFLKMQKLAGLITEGQFKKKMNENESKPYKDLLKIVSKYEGFDDEDYVGSFKEKFQGKNMITKGEWMDWSRTLDGGYDSENYAEKNWNRVKKKMNENNPDDYTPPAYEAINKLMDMINMNAKTKGRIVPYHSISWLPGVSDEDGNMDTLVYKKGKYEIAIGADDVYQDTDDPDSIIWIIQSNDPNVDFGEHMTFDEAENAAIEWLKS